MWPSSRVSSSTTKCARISKFSVLSTCDNYMEFVHWAENRSAVTETRVFDPAGGRSPKSQRASFFHLGRSSNTQASSFFGTMQKTCNAQLAETIKPWSRRSGSPQHTPRKVLEKGHVRKISTPRSPERGLDLALRPSLVLKQAQYQHSGGTPGISTECRGSDST